MINTPSDKGPLNWSLGEGEAGGSGFQANLDSMASSGQTGLFETLTKTIKQTNKIILSMSVSCNEHGQKDRQTDCQKIEAGSPLISQTRSR